MKHLFLQKKINKISKVEILMEMNKVKLNLKKQLLKKQNYRKNMIIKQIMTIMEYKYNNSNLKKIMIYKK